jgi:hypothetical protein
MMTGDMTAKRSATIWLPRYMELLLWKSWNTKRLKRMYCGYIHMRSTSHKYLFNNTARKKRKLWFQKEKKRRSTLLSIFFSFITSKHICWKNFVAHTRNVYIFYILSNNWVLKMIFWKLKRPSCSSGPKLREFSSFAIFYHVSKKKLLWSYWQEPSEQNTKATRNF